MVIQRKPDTNTLFLFVKQKKRNNCFPYLFESFSYRNDKDRLRTVSLAVSGNGHCVLAQVVPRHATPAL